MDSNVSNSIAHNNGEGMSLFSLALGTFFSWYSYVSPLLQHESDFSPYVVSGLMVVAGLGMVLGNLISGKISERIHVCLLLVLHNSF